VPSLLAAAEHVTWCTNGTTYELGMPAQAREHDAFRAAISTHRFTPCAAAGAPSQRLVPAPPRQTVKNSICEPRL
jgi:hypothetical protein